MRSRHEVNLWVVPLQMSVGAMLLFALTMIPDTLAARSVIHLPVWVTMGGIDDARAILSAMLGAVSTVLALIFSVALLMLSMVATLFGPRLLSRFVQDWVTQATIGLFLAAFIYVFLTFLVTHQDANSSFVPQISLLMSWLIVLAAFAFLVFYSHRIAVFIQNPDAVARIVDDVDRNIQADKKESRGVRVGAPISIETLEEQKRQGGIIASMTSGYVQQVEHAALVAAAFKTNSVVHLLFRPGQFVLHGETLGVVWPRTKTDALASNIQRHVTIGRHRVLQYDTEFGVAQIVEIAIRALSPAINDTFTGIACVDCVGRALLIVAAAQNSEGHWHDSRGELRLTVPPVRTARLIRQGFDQIRQAAADNPAVLIRMLTTIARILPRMSEVQAQETLVAQAQAIVETAQSSTFAKLDRSDIEHAWEKISAWQRGTNGAVA